MGQLELFQAALGIAKPWRVLDATFAPEESTDWTSTWTSLAAHTSPAPRATPNPARCMTPSPKAGGTWTSSSIGLTCTLGCRASLAWCMGYPPAQYAMLEARERVLTLLFEALVLEMAVHIPVAAIARMVCEDDTRIWGVLEHYVQAPRAELDFFSEVGRVGVDETSLCPARPGLRLGVLRDLDGGRVMFATGGRNAATVGRFARDKRLLTGANPSR